MPPAPLPNILGRCPTPVPHAGFSLVESDARHALQSFAEQLENRHDSAGFAQHVNVVKESAQLLAPLQRTRHLHHCPLNPDGKQQRHRVSLLASLCLSDVPLPSGIIHPNVTGRGSIRQPHEWQDCLGTRHLHESLEHRRPQHVVVSSVAVDAEDCRVGVAVSCSADEMPDGIGARSRRPRVLEWGAPASPKSSRPTASVN